MAEKEKLPVSYCSPSGREKEELRENNLETLNYAQFPGRSGDSLVEEIAREVKASTIW